MDIINIDVIFYITLRSVNDTLIITVINARLRSNRSINIIICRHPLLKRSAGNLTCDNAGIRVVRQYSHPCCQFLLCCVIGVYSAHVIIANTIYKRVQQCLLVISPILAVHDLTLNGYGCTKLVFLVDTIGNCVDLCFGQADSGTDAAGRFGAARCGRCRCIIFRLSVWNFCKSTVINIITGSIVGIVVHIVIRRIVYACHQTADAECTDNNADHRIACCIGKNRCNNTSSGWIRREVLLRDFLFNMFQIYAIKIFSE